MKAQILKIAGVKSEKEFYKKFPSEEAFMKKHGKEFKKAQVGTNIATSAAGSFNIYNPYGDAMQSADMSGMQNYTNGTSPFGGYHNLGQVPNFQTPNAAAGFMPKDSFSMTTPKLNLFDPQGDQSQTKMAQGIFEGAHSVADSPFKTKPSMPGAQQIIGGVTGIADAFGAMKQQKNKLEKLRQQKGVADVSLKAEESVDVDARRQQSENIAKQREAQMPVNTGEEFFPIYGVGTNVLARNGLRLQGGGEIQNTFDPNDIYTDSGYEPLNDSNIKQYAQGGQFSSFMDAGGADFANKAIGGAFGNNAGYQGGVAAANMLKMIPGVGPVASALAAPVLGAIGGGLDQAFGSAGKIKKTQAGLDRTMMGIQNAGTAKSIHAQNQSYMEDGGWVSHDWQPQVIASFGEHKLKDLLQPPHDADMLRAGGHLREYTPPSDRAMETAQHGYTMTKSPNFINAKDTITEYDPYLHKDVPIYTTPIEYRMGLQSATPNSSWYDPKESELGVVQMDNLRDYDMLTQESNNDYTFPIGDANERASTAAKYFDRSGKLSYTAGSADYKNITPDTEKTLARIHEGQTRKNGGPVESYGLGGELQTHWGGGAETISRNPYLPGTGETVMFRGKSHEEKSPNGETGIGVTYGGNPVEVERGEPMVELEEGGTIDPETGEVQKSGVVFGNLQIPNQYIDMLGDKNAKGKKFKNYVADLSKTEEKQNSIIDKSSKELNTLDPINSFDKLKLTALQANIQGANMKLKSIADKKINAAALQNAINDTAEEHGLVADDLARGKAKINKEVLQEYAEYGKSIKKAQGGTTIDLSDYETNFIKNFHDAIGMDPKTPGYGKLIGKKSAELYNNWLKTNAPDYYMSAQDLKEKGADIRDVFYGKEKSPKKSAELLTKSFLKYPGELDKKFLKEFNLTPEGYKYIGKDKQAATTTSDSNVQPTALDEVVITPSKKEEDNIYPIEPKKTNWWDTGITALNAALPYLRPSDAEALDAAQLYPEMFAMATNQVAPVQAQTFQPDLATPYDISFQDQLNANQADYRAAQRMMGYNPAAQANLNAQKYQANQSVLADQFRANQAMKDKVYGENRNILNQAKLTNLGIFDKQYERQTEALANTKATTQAALNSIADKYAKNKLENRELKTYENMYNYRFGPNFRAQNMNPLAQWDIDYKGASAEELEAMAALKKAQDKKEAAAAKKDKAVSRNGSIVKSYKNI